MNILLITELFPTDEKQSRIEQTYVLHTFVKHWLKDPDVSVTVIVPREKHIRNELDTLKKSQSVKDRIKRLYRTFFPSWRDSTPFHFHGVDGTMVWVRKWGNHRYTVGNIMHTLKKKSFFPDIVVSHLPVGGLIAAQVSTRFRTPHLHSVHMTDYRFCNAKKFTTFYRSPDALGYRSWALQKLMHTEGITPPREEVIPSGISEDILLKNIQEVNTDTPFSFLSVCLLRKLKNIDTNLIALAQLKEVDWTYTVIGSGPEEDNLKALTKKLEIEDRVTFMGYREHARCLQAMEEHDVFLQVSAPETFGMVYIEAMAKGMVVVGSYDNGVDGFVTDGENGFLCEPDNADALHGTLKKICRSTSLADIQNAALKSAATLTEEKACTHYLNFIKDVSS